jgi:hypothetical protein
VVYVPAGYHPATSLIVRGSGIVGRLDRGQLAEIYFEGAVFGQINIVTYADRVEHAFGRLEADYPTTAKMVVPRDALIPVGIFLPGERRIELTGPVSEERVARWLGQGDGHLDPIELLCRGLR